MNQEKKSWQDAETLARYLGGEMSEAESIRFEQELSVTGENVIRIEQLKKQWAAMKGYRVVKHPDARKAWARLHDRLANEDLIPAKMASGSSVRFFLPVLKVAATLLFLIAIGAVILFILNRNHTDEMVRINTGEGSGTLVKAMPDGSVVYIGPQSVCSYSEGFNRDNRLMALEGEAFFDVAPDRLKPFIIQTEEVTIRVVGTAFNVVAEKGRRFELTVDRGNVQVMLNNNTDKVETVLPGERISLSGDNLVKSATGSVETTNWYRECMHFKDEELETIIRVLNRNFNTNFVLSHKITGKRKLTVTFRNESAEDMTRLICMTLNLESRTINGTVVLSEIRETQPGE